jgi:hypothetical protein
MFGADQMAVTDDFWRELNKLQQSQVALFPQLAAPTLQRCFEEDQLW